MTTTLREAAQQALEALEAFLSDELRPYEAAKTSTALRAALAQQAEPVGPVACCDLEERKALSSVKLPCDVRIGHGTHRKGSSLLALVVRSRSLYQMAKSDDYYGYASRLAVALWEKHYKDIAPQWKPLDDLMGVLTQIDNMASGLTRLAQQAESVADPFNCPKCGRHDYGLHGACPTCDAQQAEPVGKPEGEQPAGVVVGFTDEGRAIVDHDGLEEGWVLYTTPPQQAEPQTTHSSECWRWHHKCAVAKIERECKHD